MNFPAKIVGRYGPILLAALLAGALAGCELPRNGKGPAASAAAPPKLAPLYAEADGKRLFAAAPGSTVVVRA